MNRVLLVEVGNTSLKAMTVPGTSRLSFEELFSIPYVKMPHGKRVDAEFFESLRKAFGYLAGKTSSASDASGGKPFSVCYFSCVAAELEDALISFLEESICDKLVDMGDVLKSGELTVVQIWRSPIGIDRLLAMEFLHRVGFDDFLVASFGTATVLDVVSGGRHRAGFIMPGFEGSLKALTTVSPVLKERFNADSHVSFSPADTSEAMLSGIVLPCVSFVEDLIRIYSLKRLFITGGAAATFAGVMKKILKEKPLVLEELALRAMALLSGSVEVVKSPSE